MTRSSVPSQPLTAGNSPRGGCAPVARLAYIGDAPTDLRTAAAAGARAVAAGWGHLYDPAEPADATLASPGEALGLLAT